MLRKGGGGSLRLEARLESVQLLDYFTPDTRFPQVTEPTACLGRLLTTFLGRFSTVSRPFLDRFSLGCVAHTTVPACAALIMAIKSDFDVYNALDIFQNGTVLKDLKFGIGDGRLQYYIYNWRTAEVSASEVRKQRANAHKIYS